MAYKSRFYKKKARGLYAVERKVDKIIRRFKPEVKKADTNLIGSVATGLTNQCFPLMLIPEGLGSLNRIGLRINGISLHMKYSIRMVNTYVTSNVRVVVFIDKKTESGVQASFDQIFTGSTVPTLLYSGKDVSSADRFRILYDRTHNLSDANNPNPRVEKYLKLHNLDMAYSGSGATNYKQNGVFVAWISDQAVGTPPIDFYASLKYTDM